MDYVIFQGQKFKMGYTYYDLRTKKFNSLILDQKNIKSIEQIEGLEELTELEYLELRGNQISEIKGLDTLVNLKVLYLQETQNLYFKILLI